MDSYFGYTHQTNALYDIIILIIILSVFIIRHTTSPWRCIVTILFYKQIDCPTNFTDLATNVLGIICYALYSIYSLTNKSLVS